MQLSDGVFLGFHDELEKLAVDMHRLLGNAGAAGGVGALVGAGGGALAGGVRKYRQARAEGESVAQGVARGVGGALHGAGTGALVGAGAGALYGAAAPQAFHRGLSQVGGPIGAGARFGQRQVHAFTGWLPKAGDPKSLESLRGGAYGARKTLGNTQKELASATAHGQTGGALRSAEKSVERARGGLEGAEKAQAMGLTSIPGYARALRADPGKALRTGMAEQWRSGGLGAKAMLLGLPAMGAVGAMRAPEAAAGPGKGERVGRELGMTAGYLATAPLGFVPGQVVSSAIGRAGSLVGRGVDRLRGRRGGSVQHAPSPENVTGQHVPTERVVSPTMEGKPGEGVR